MKFPPVSDIRKIRKSLDITQSDLAIASGVSQSTIAKIECGRTSASYETVVKLFDTLEFLKTDIRDELRAIDVASHGVTSVTSTDTVHKASEVMKSTGFSQLPVIDGGVPVGSISERVIFEMIRSGATMEKLAVTPVGDAMKEQFPVISDNTPMSAVTSLMAGYNAVLVSRKGDIVGMITSADILKLI